MEQPARARSLLYDHVDERAEPSTEGKTCLEELGGDRKDACLGEHMELNEGEKKTCKAYISVLNLEAFCQSSLQPAKRFLPS